ncbi:CD276 antigen-like [Scyliorhinus canicula]|uniref:CD276 antigen-like n=1 Tax=Scyliorhinus canicula TaxID=7830 RepID=UPI0018F6ADF8|nr:CD276 antigen-like [Scyliorhinus canicula]
MAGVRRRHFLSLLCLFAFPLLFCHSFTIASLAPSTMVALFGRDVILPCSFTPHPSMTLLRMVVTWQLLDTDTVVHSYYYQRDQLDRQDPAYLHRTKLFPEELLEGNASLQLNIVRLDDEAQYMCTVSNEFGSSSGTVKLLVAGDLWIFDSPHLTFTLCI